MWIYIHYWSWWCSGSEHLRCLVQYISYIYNICHSLLWVHPSLVFLNGILQWKHTILDYSILMLIALAATPLAFWTSETWFHKPLYLPITCMSKPFWRRTMRKSPKRRDQQQMTLLTLLGRRKRMGTVHISYYQCPIWLNSSLTIRSHMDRR